jgi:hypothetical protein
LALLPFGVKKTYLWSFEAFCPNLSIDKLILFIIARL